MHQMQISLLVEELSYRDDVGSVVVEFETSQLLVDIGITSAHFDLPFQAAVAPVE